MKDARPVRKGTERKGLVTVPRFQSTLLAIGEKSLGPQHPDLATWLHNLAWLYENQGKNEQAEPLFQRALAIHEEQLGNGHPAPLNVRRDYASLLHAVGRVAEAEQVEARGRG